MKLNWPVAAPRSITRNFYFKSSIYIGGMHAALDIIPVGRPAFGEPLLAVETGAVVAKGWGSQDGWYIHIDHALGWRACYRHLREPSSLSVGQQVVQGQVVGYMDSTGNVTGPHLHFDLWNKQRRSDEAFYKVGWYAHDPEYWIGREQGQEDWLMALTDAEQKELLNGVRIIVGFLGDKPSTAGPDGLPSFDDFADRRRFILLPNRLYLVEKYVLDIKKKLGA